MLREKMEQGSVVAEVRASIAWQERIDARAAHLPEEVHSDLVSRLRRVCIEGLLDGSQLEGLADVDTTSIPDTSLLAELSHHSVEACLLVDLELARVDPVPEWAVNDVLMSPDLLQHILGNDSLNAWDCAAARMCRQWHDTWAASVEQRRGLSDCYQLDFGDNTPYGLLTSTHCGLLCWITDSLSVDEQVHLYQRQEHGRGVGLLRTVQLPVGMHQTELCCMSSTRLYIGRFQTCISVDLTSGAVVATCDHDFDALFGLAMFGDKLVATGRNDEHSNGLLVLNSTTLELLVKVTPIADGFVTRALAVGGDEIYVGMDMIMEGYGNDHGTHHETVAAAVAAAAVATQPAICVLTRTGETARQLRGHWESVDQLCFVNDRLYLSEEARRNGRIFVVTPQGETLAEYGCPAWQETPSSLCSIINMMCWQNELIIRLRRTRVEAVFDLKTSQSSGEVQYLHDRGIELWTLAVR